jgi:hypothetical protein
LILPNRLQSRTIFESLRPTLVVAIGIPVGLRHHQPIRAYRLKNRRLPMSTIRTLATFANIFMARETWFWSLPKRRFGLWRKPKVWGYCWMIFASSLFFLAGWLSEDHQTPSKRVSS